MNEQYVTSGAIRRKYAVCNSTLINWADGKKVRSLRFSGTGKRLYHIGDVEGVLGVKVDERDKEQDSSSHRRYVCNARVSSAKQAQDLERQAERLKEARPEHELVKEIGSGINWKRPKFLALVDAVMRREVSEIVASHRDRIARFAFDLVNHICGKHKCKTRGSRSGRRIGGQLSNK